MSPRRYVMLDRDGTVIEPHHYLDDPAKVKLIPGAAEGLRQIMDAGFGLVVLTNQSAIARGIIDTARLAQIHQRMNDLLLTAANRLRDWPSARPKTWTSIPARVS